MHRKPCCIGPASFSAGGVVDMAVKAWLFFALMLASLPLQAAFDSTHKQWDLLLKQYVHWSADGTTTRVDYAGFRKDQLRLQGYLKEISSVSRQEYSRWTWQEQQAFLINAYNAHTVSLVLTRYPDLVSIKDLGGIFSSPWKLKFFTLLGEKRGLDDIEHNLLRGDKRYRDPRIHFAVNCASIGCPALRDEAYTAAKLDSQLEDQTLRFLKDKTRNHLNLQSGEYSISAIFKWYGEDFDRHSGGVNAFLIRYSGKTGLSQKDMAFIKSARFKVRFLDYDWSLNRSR